MRRVSLLGFGFGLLISVHGMGDTTPRSPLSPVYSASRERAVQSRETYAIRNVTVHTMKGAPVEG
ncbi:MAG: hypothetical protein SNJ72_06715, partial [Fimbriimonadales bacterium]